MSDREDSGGAWWVRAHEEGGVTPRAVALVAHGLNVRPERMSDVGQALAERGVESLVLALQGHLGAVRDDAGADEARLAAFRSVSRAGWLEETRRAYALARARATALDRPLLLVGYSLGGLVGLDLLCDPRGSTRFEAMILFAPPLSTRWLPSLIRVLAPFPRLLIPSLSPAEFAANRGTPIAAYNALFGSIARLRASSMAAANVPALLFIDRKDELVSPSGLSALRERKRLDRWKICLLDRTLRGGEPDYHHLIISKERLGSDAWQRIAAEIASFLADLDGGGASPATLRRGEAERAPCP